jgi:hypothetical protein
MLGVLGGPYIVAVVAPGKRLISALRYAASASECEGGYVHWKMLTLLIGHGGKASGEGEHRTLGGLDLGSAAKAFARSSPRRFTLASVAAGLQNGQLLR